uniref:Glycosyltransferase n=1 Tax=viral metagenome TaxID=1070528 RepID=A0A6C0BTL7_9ZZZZ
MVTQPEYQPLQLYVGLTCLPGREDNFEKCLNSFISQKRQPNKVFVSYCSTYKRFPDSKFDIKLIEKFKDNELFEFIESDIDYGPATKFMASINRLKEIEQNNLDNTYLIVCDDDRTYYDYFIDNYYNLIKNDNDRVYTGYLEMLDKNKNFKIAFGADGYNIKGTWFDKLVNWYNTITSFEPEGKEAWYHDDHICSSFFHYNKLTVELTRKKSCHRNYVDEVSLTAFQNKRNDGRRTRLNSKCGMCYNKIRHNCNNNLDDRNKYLIKEGIFFD